MDKQKTQAKRRSYETYPQPTTPKPTIDQLRQWTFGEGGCEATDGCWVEPDGVCTHGHPSWLLRMGMI